LTLGSLSERPTVTPDYIDGSDVPLPFEGPEAPITFADGASRCVSPAETWSRIEPLLRPAGITRVADVTGLDRLGVPVFVACRPNSRALATAQGKGLSRDAARVSAAMEALESYCAERAALPLLLRTRREFAVGQRLIDVERLPRVRGGKDLDAVCLWARGRSLIDGQPTWVPFEMVHSNYTLPLPTGSGQFVMSSNGLASGNTPQEAIAHALYELIERDSVSLFHRARGSEAGSRRVLVDELPWPQLGALVSRLQQLGVLVGVWDCTSDLDVPCFECRIVDRDPLAGAGYAAVGMGCHLSPEVAFSRAVTEAIQSRLTYITGSREDALPERYRYLQNNDVTTRALEDILKIPAQARPVRNDAPFDVLRSHDQQVAHLLRRLSSSGLTEAVAVRLQPQNYPIAVVRVIVPGLEHVHDAPGYLPGQRALAVSP
jgi:YcaO-like protein with predicted kinase domain